MIPNPAAYSVTAAVIITTGSDYESKEENGIAHFLEHMCFKGTKNRPRAIDIAAEFDGLGAEYNAFTSRSYTSYYAKIKSDAWKKVLDIVSDIYQNSTFDEKEIEKEKGVVIEEMHMYDDQPAEKLADAFISLMYGDTPQGRKILGTEETVRGLTREKIIKYHETHYSSAATIVLLSGNFDSEEASKELETRFGVLAVGKKTEYFPVLENQGAKAELVLEKESDQTHIILGFRTFPVSDERRFALFVLSNILGGGMSSRLFQRIREELGAAYYVSMSPSLTSDRGLLSLSAGLEHKKIEEVLKASCDELRRIKKENISPAELKKAKDHLIGGLFLSLESSEEIAYYYGRQEINSLALKNPEWFKSKIEEVSAADVMEVAREVFMNKNLNFAAIGPLKDKSFLNVLDVE